MCTKRLLSVVLFAFVALRPVESLSPEEVDKANLATRAKCIEESGTTLELVEGMHQGSFPDDRGLKCFTACVMKLLNAVTPDGLLDLDKLDQALAAFLDPAPYAHAHITVDYCRHIDYSTDICEASYQYVDCYYHFDNIFIFP